MGAVTSHEVMQRLCDASARARAAGVRPAYGLRWVMSREWYDRIRAEAFTEEQEQQRAETHHRALIDPHAGPPWRCPVCTAEPFGDFGELAGHVRRFADPGYREPDPRDRLLDWPVSVRPDAGEPELVAEPQIVAS